MKPDLHEVAERLSVEVRLVVGEDLREEDHRAAPLAHRPQGVAAVLEPFEGHVRFISEHPGAGRRFEQRIARHADDGHHVAVPEPRHQGHALARPALDHVHLGHLGEPDPHLPQREQRVVVARPLAAELLDPAGGGDLHDLGPGMAKLDADVVEPRGLRMGQMAAGPNVRGGVRRALPAHAAHRAGDVIVFEDVDLEVAELRDVAAPELEGGRHRAELGEVVAHERGGRQHVHLGRAHPVVPEVVHVAGEDRFHRRPPDLAEQPGAGGLVDVVVVAGSHRGGGCRADSA